MAVLSKHALAAVAGALALAALTPSGVGAADNGAGATPRPGAAVGAAATDDLRALLEAAREGARSAKVTADNIVVVPDLLVQILAKLDKLEDKVARLEIALKAQPPAKPAR